MHLIPRPDLRDTNPAGLSRRQMLRLGGLVATAGPLGHWFTAPRAVAGANAARGLSAPGKARSCILVYLLGGPPQLDMWDLKPQAPAEIRGPFQPIATSLPGFQICEHLPLLAGMAHKYAVVRSVTHPNNNHTPMIYYTLTGRHVQTPEMDNDISPPSRIDSPHLGSVLAHFKTPPAALPGFVSMPELAVRSNDDNIRPAVPLRGGRAGFLGPRVDPLIINGDPREPGALDDLVLRDEMTAERFSRRQQLLAAIEGRSPARVAGHDYGHLRNMAVRMTGSPGDEKLYSLQSEPAALRERYGLHRFGQSMLLARRLAEAGVPMISVHFNHMTRCDGWDTHAKNFEGLKDELLPLLDQGLSALIDDLEARGVLEETFVLVMGEFGRTPRINPAAGRDHWGLCSSVLLAGGGIRGGVVVGSSDKQAALPRSRPVDPVDIHATMYRCMGLPASLEIHDQFNRPLAISTGQVIEELV